MKLLFDENLSHKLAWLLSDAFPEGAHVSTCRIGSDEDPEIWAFAKRNQFVIVSKDSDFYQLSLLNGAPPKFIWIRNENCRTRELRDLLMESADLLGQFERDSEASVLILPSPVEL